MPEPTAAKFVEEFEFKLSLHLHKEPRPMMNARSSTEEHNKGPPSMSLLFSTAPIGDPLPRDVLDSAPLVIIPLRPGISRNGSSGTSR